MSDAPSSSTPRTGKQSPGALLDEILPLVEPATAEVHYKAAVLEVSDPAQLLELAADPLLQPLLLCRLAPNVALVDPGRAADLAEALRKRGHTPKIVKP